MKTIAVLLLLTSASVFAAEPTVFCKTSYGKVYNLLLEDGFECRDSLLMPNTNLACFVGDRGEVIDILNSVVEGGLFEGTDGEYIEDAKYKGRKEIAYTIVDDANGVKDAGTLKRCTAEFFKNSNR